MATDLITTLTTAPARIEPLEPQNEIDAEAVKDRLEARAVNPI